MTLQSGYKSRKKHLLSAAQETEEVLFELNFWEKVEGLGCICERVLVHVRVHVLMRVYIYPASEMSLSVCSTGLSLVAGR